MPEDARYDALIGRIRERAADPERRIDERQSQLMALATSGGLDGMLDMTRSLMADLQRLVRDGADDAIVARAEGLRSQMLSAAEKPLPAPATEAEIAGGEARIGVALPPLLRRLYTEVAHGGFGPGPGLVGFRPGATTDKGDTIEDLYAGMLEATNENPRWIWPRELIPVVDLSGAYLCVDASTPAGRVVEFDFEELDDDDSADGGWSGAFTERAPSVEAWLAKWVASNAPAFQQFMIGPPTMGQYDIPEVTRAYWADMTPEERAEHGLPEKGWGRALFGEAWGDDPRDQ